jgi:hypothetical protein
MESREPRSMAAQDGISLLLELIQGTMSFTCACLVRRYLSPPPLTPSGIPQEVQTQALAAATMQAQGQALEALLLSATVLGLADGTRLPTPLGSTSLNLTAEWALGNLVVVRRAMAGVAWTGAMVLCSTCVAPWFWRGGDGS